MKTRNTRCDTFYCVLLHTMFVVRSCRENMYAEEMCKVALTC